MTKTHTTENRRTHTNSLAKREPAQPRLPLHQPVARHTRTAGFERVHRFEDSHALAASYGADWWIPIYRRAFPTLMSAVAIEQDGWAQRAGIDRLLTLACGRTFTVDEKIRTQDWPDVLLERWSDEKRKTPGWVQKPLACDFIAYAYAPAATCVLLPVPALQRAWRQHGRQWIGLYGQRRAQNRGYTTISVPVPRGVLMQAIVEAMFVS
ncbi:hypothetical protein [Sphingomonas glacialis]|uniref:hypothetical protein n=1 Tax=Sphingomonas glacialis TaxID=658225 RepID=UPI001F4FCBD0|nr:hypothetical protein [Sphingomonas glacialis]